MKIKHFITAGVSLGMLAAGLSGGPAHAAPAGSGYDDSPDVIVGGGSDTTYLVQQRIDTLYNGAPGCVLNGAAPGLCVVPSSGDTKGDFDHDNTVEAAAAGSGAGIKALLGTGTYTPAISYARSSRVPSAAELAGTTGWGFSRDAIAVVSFGTRTIALQRQDLVDIYTCGKTDWSQITDAVTGLPETAGTIVPWDMNAASGTRATFTTWLANGGAAVVFGTCVRKLQPVPPAAAIAPFENDVKPILADVGPDGVAGTADDDANNYVWWMSFGDWQKYPYTRNGAHAGASVASNLVSLTNDSAVSAAIPPSNGSTNNLSYAILRTLYVVTRNTDADCATPAGNATPGPCDPVATPTTPGVVSGAASGPGGAVHAFVDWLCRLNSAGHTTDSVTGVNYRVEINNAIFAEGFQLIPSSLKTPGFSCAVTS
jgi:ABC-type phosphate transport system substrate-binding protein